MGRGEFSRVSLKVCLFTLVISIWGISPSWGLIYIDINSPSGVRIPVAIPALLGEDPLGNSYSMAIAKALASDLEISAVFKVINRKYLFRDDFER